MIKIVPKMTGTSLNGQKNEQKGVRHASVKGQRLHLRQERVGEHVEVGQRAERRAPERGLASDLLAEGCFSHGGAEGQLRQRVHG